MALGNGERYYSPNYARFIQQDSYAGMPDMPQSLNRFSYGYNNPFRYSDPTGNIADDNRGSLANSAREYGLNKNGDNNWWNVTKNFAARTGYDLWDTISLGSLSREEENMAAWENGEITTEQAGWNTFKNGSLAAAKVGLMVVTAGAGNALMAGAGLATRIGIGAGLGVAEQFGNDVLEMGFGFRNEFSSAGSYALAGITGGVFGAASPGKAATAFAKENKLTLGTELRFLKSEARELGQSIGQRLNPRNYNFKFNNNVLGSNGGGFEIEFKPKSASEDYYFRGTTYKRGTTEIYEGNPNVVAERGISVSDNPAKATTFAVQGRNLGEPVLLAAPKSRFAMTERLEPNYRAGLEEETILNMTAKQFYNNTTHTIPVDKARAVLKDMKIEIPRNIYPGEDRLILESIPKMPKQQIIEFMKRIGEAK